MSALEGKVALVTGASRGIGRAIAIRLGGLGAAVALNYREAEEAAREAAGEARAAGARAATMYRADVSDPDEAEALVARVHQDLGPVDILVNNAGIQRSMLMHKMSVEDWRRVMAVNVDAAFYLCRAVLPGMLERRSGNIVNVASASSFMAQRGAAAYVTSKHAVIGFTKTLALETAARGVRVNAVAPGLTETDMVRGLNDEQRETLVGIIPIRRMGAPAEVADMVAFVLTGATYSTGNVFHVGGGVVMG